MCILCFESIVWFKPKVTRQCFQFRMNTDNLCKENLISAGRLNRIYLVGQKPGLYCWTSTWSGNFQHFLLHCCVANYEHWIQSVIKYLRLLSSYIPINFNGIVPSFQKCRPRQCQPILFRCVILVRKFVLCFQHENQNKIVQPCYQL